MYSKLNRIAGFAAGAALCTAAVACSGGRNRTTAMADSTGMNNGAGAGSTATTATATTATGTDTTAAAGTVASSSAAWTDANTLGFVTAANNSEIAEAKLAERKATSPAVKSFARMMVRDHTQMLHQGQAAAKKMNLSHAQPTTDVVTNLQKDSKDELKDLSGKTGKSFDKAYIDAQVKDHQMVADSLQQALQSTQNTQLHASLQKALTTVQGHLQRAQQLKTTLGA